MLEHLHVTVLLYKHYLAAILNNDELELMDQIIAKHSYSLIQPKMSFLLIFYWLSTYRVRLGCFSLRICYPKVPIVESVRCETWVVAWAWFSEGSLGSCCNYIACSKKFGCDGTGRNFSKNRNSDYTEVVKSGIGTWMETRTNH